MALLLKENVKVATDSIKGNKLRVLIKKTIAYHVVRVGILDGSNIKYSNTEWYKEEIANKYGYTKRIFEIEKEFVFEQGYK